MNKLYANQLPQQLQQGLGASYVVFGDEPLQMQESLDCIRQHVQQQGFTERQQFKIDAQFDWGQLTAAMQSMSLFSDRQLIELDLSQQKLTTTSSKELKTLAELLHPDILLLIYGDRSPAEVARQSWLKAFPTNTVFVSIYPLDEQQFRQWLQQQLRREQLQLSADAMLLFQHHCSGNLLAARQNIDKLLLTFGPCTLDEMQLTAFLSDQSSFTIFQLSDALLAGHSQQAFHRLERLCGQDEEPTLIGWQLQREVNHLLQLQQASPTERNALFKKLGIWPKRQPLYQQALQRLPLKWLHYLVQEFAAFDRLYKSGHLQNSQLALTHLAALFIVPVAKTYSLRQYDHD